DLDAPLGGVEGAGEDLGQGGLARAVAAHQPHPVTGGDLEGDVAHQEPGADSDGEVVHGDHGRAPVRTRTMGPRAGGARPGPIRGRQSQQGGTICGSGYPGRSRTTRTGWGWALPASTSSSREDTTSWSRRGPASAPA